MMEFTLARVAMGVCGLMIMAILLNPMNVLLESDVDRETEGNCEALGAMLDRFAVSDADKLTVCLNESIPSGSQISFDDGILVLRTGDCEYTYICRQDIDADKESYGCNDVLFIQKTKGGLSIVSA